jgi:hypothetical protein
MDVKCYGCREPVPGRAEASLLRSWAKRAALLAKCVIACSLLAGIIAVVQPAAYGNLGQNIVAVMKAVK